MVRKLPITFFKVKGKHNKHIIFMSLMLTFTLHPDPCIKLELNGICLQLQNCAAQCKGKNRSGRCTQYMCLMRLQLLLELHGTDIVCHFYRELNAMKYSLSAMKKVNHFHDAKVIFTEVIDFSLHSLTSCSHIRVRMLSGSSLKAMSSQ